MNHFLETKFGSIILTLFPGKFAFVSALDLLIIADLHLGRSAHYQKHGIPMPSSAERHEIMRLEKGIKTVNPKRVLVLGDMFHSVHNADFERFVKWREFYSHVKFELVPGNHDIVEKAFYSRAGIEIKPEAYEESGICFIHDGKEQTERLQISGHVHPAVILRGQAYQSLKLDCFWQRGLHLVMPAFTSWGGHYTIKPKKGDKVFVCAKTELHLFDN